MGSISPPGALCGVVDGFVRGVNDGGALHGGFMCEGFEGGGSERAGC